MLQVSSLQTLHSAASAVALLHFFVHSADVYTVLYCILFACSRCPPCRRFTPQLANTYTKLKKDGKEFEVVFVSMDKNQAQFDVRHLKAAAI
jgi:thiol-disulfide isomerase/thioredoxin